MEVQVIDNPHIIAAIICLCLVFIPVMVIYLWDMPKPPKDKEPPTIGPMYPPF